MLLGIQVIKTNDFWHALSALCSSSPFSWSLHGNFNATLSFAESSSTAPQVDNSHQDYSAFLQETNGLDLWWSQPDYSLQCSFTYNSSSHPKVGALYTPPPIPTGLPESYQTELGLGQISCWLITIQILYPSPSGVLVNSYWNNPKSQGIVDSLGMGTITTLVLQITL